jgi:hypothetical protein
MDGEMETVTVEAMLEASVGRVWTLLGDLEAMAGAAGIEVEVNGTGVGATRTIRIGGQTMVERIDAIDHLGHRLTYTMVEGIPFPATRYGATMQLEAAAGQTTRLVWTGRFEPASADAAEIAATKRRIADAYRGGIEQIRGALQG